MQTDTTKYDQLLFETGKDHIENLKIILSIMKKNNISYVNVKEWDDDMMGHWIEAPDNILKIFSDYKE